MRNFDGRDHNNSPLPPCVNSGAKNAVSPWSPQKSSMCEDVFKIHSERYIDGHGHYLSYRTLYRNQSKVTVLLYCDI